MARKGSLLRHRSLVRLVDLQCRGGSFSEGPSRCVTSKSAGEGVDALPSDIYTAMPADDERPGDPPKMHVHLRSMFKQERPKLRTMAMSGHRDHAQLSWALKGVEAMLRRLCTHDRNCFLSALWPPSKLGWSVDSVGPNSISHKLRYQAFTSPIRPLSPPSVKYHPEFY